MSAGLNVLWFVLGGGWLLGTAWYLSGALMFVSIIGMPWAKACFTLGKFSYCPFGKEVVARNDMTGRQDVGTGPLGIIGNILWFVVLGGLWLALFHLLYGVLCALTLIGIPFALQHFKLAALALSPIGKSVESSELAALVRQDKAAARLEAARAG